MQPLAEIALIGRSVPAGVATLVMIAATTVGCGTDEVDGAQQGGPAKVPVTSNSMTDFPTGKAFSDAYSRVHLTGNIPGVLKGVEILGDEDGYFEFLGVMVAGPERKFGSIQTAKTYPPHNPGLLGPLAEAPGAVLTTDKAGSLLIVGLRATRDGIGSRTGLRVFYSVEGKQYFLDFPASVTNCPPGTPTDECDAAIDKAFEAALELDAGYDDPHD